MAEKQIPAIIQVGEKVGINVESPQHGLHISGSGTGIALHIENGSTNADVMRIKTNGGANATMTFQPDHIYTDSNLHLQSDSGQIFFRGAGHHFGATTSATEKLELTGNFKIHGNNSAFSNFTSGYIGGAGWSINYDGSTSNLEVDNILVRNTLQTNIFQKDIVKAVNGLLYISDSGVIAATGSNTVTFNSSSATFSDGDLILFKDVDTSSGDIKAVYFRITGSASDTTPDSMQNTSYTYSVGNITGSLPDLVIGGTAVRVSGGSLLLDASSPNSPFMDVISDSTTYVRTGNLAGITSANLGSLSGFGFWASGSAYLEGGINATSGSIGGWTIEPGIIQSGNIKLDTVSDSGRIVVGTLTGDSTATTNYGFLAKNDGTVLIKGNESNTNYLKFTTSTLDINTDTFRLDTPQLDIDSARYAIDVGSAIKISGSANSNAGQIKVGANVILNGNDTSTISGWNIATGHFVDSNNNIKLDSTGTYPISTSKFQVSREGNITGSQVLFSGGEIAKWKINSTYLVDSANKVKLEPNGTYPISTSRFQVSSEGNITGSRVLFSGGQIAGWSIDSSTIFNSNVTMSNANGGKISLNNGTTFLSGSGEGQFANGGIQFDKDGNTIITGSVTIGADVTVNADVAIGSLPNFPSSEKLLMHYDFASGTGTTLIDNSGNGQDMTIYNPIAITWTNDSPAGGALSGSKADNTYASTGNTFNCGNSITVTSWLLDDGNLSQHMAWGIDTDNSNQLNLFGTKYPDNSSATAGYYLNNGDSYDNPFSMGGTQVNRWDYTGSYHHFAVTINQALNKSLLHIDGTLVGSASYKDPTTTNDEFVLARYGNDNSYHWGGKIAQVRVYDTALEEDEIQSLFLYPDGPGGTRISGDTISTGIIKSNNLTTTAGSELDLTAGTIKLGGTLTPSFSIDEQGTVSASKGRIGGWDITNQYIGYYTGADHMYLARDAHGFNSSNYTANKPVLSVYNTSRNFKIDIGNTLYGAANNSGIMCWYDYQDADGKLFEMSTDGTNFTASIASFDFTHTSLRHKTGNSDFMITNNPKVDISNTAHEFGEGKSNIMILDGDADFLLSMGASTWDNTSRGANAGIVVYNDYTENSKIFEATSRRDSHEGNITASIAGWDFNTTRIAKSNVTMSSADGGKLTLGSSEQILLSGSGAGHLAGGNISFTKEGSFSISNVTSIHETFSDKIEANKLFLTASGLVQNITTTTPDGNGIAKYETGETGSYFRNSTANNDGWDSGFMSIAKFKRSLGATLEVDFIVNEQYSATAIGFANANSSLKDLETPTNRNHLVEGVYVQTRDFNVYSDHDNNKSATQQGSNALGSDVWIDGTDKYMRLKIELKPDGGADYTIYRDGLYDVPMDTYSSSGNTVEDVIVWICIHYDDDDNPERFITFDDMRVYNTNQNSLVIDGGNIVAGKIRSNNWTADKGSQFDLNAGTIQLGGIESPKFAVNTAGAVTSSAGSIGGWNISDTSINTTGSNGTRFQIHKNEGISARPVSSSMETNAGEFSFGIATISVEPGGGTIYDGNNNVPENQNGTGGGPGGGSGGGGL